MMVGGGWDSASRLACAACSTVNVRCRANYSPIGAHREDDPANGSSQRERRAVTIELIDSLSDHCVSLSNAFRIGQQLPRLLEFPRQTVCSKCAGL